MKLIKPFLWILLAGIVLILLYLAGVIGYAWVNDYLPPAQESVEIKGEAAEPFVNTDTLTFFDWNIGFAGLGEESDFFYDGGTMVRMPEEIVRKNLDGILQTLVQYQPETDFFLLQEVDLRSKRSYQIDEVSTISEQLPGFTQAFGKNYEVKFVPLPFTNPLGKVRSGVSTWSRFGPLEATRYNFEGNYSFPNYLFFLDRCFLLKRFPLINGKELVVINTHNSAYDDGSLKKQQMEQMKAVLLTEYEKGNFVVVGGDWNQFPAGYQGFLGFKAPMNETKLFVPETYPAPGWKWAYDPSVATNRQLVAPYNTDSTTRSIIDFYLLSPNVELLEIRGVDLDFKYSDHQPVRMKVALKNEMLQDTVIEEKASE